MVVPKHLETHAQPAETGVSRRSLRTRGKSSRQRVQSIVLSAALFTLAIVLPLFRQRHAPSWNTIWSEDGSIYLTQATQGGGMHSLFRSYAGYLQLPPRAVSAFAAVLPLRSAAWFLAVSATLVGALLGWFVYWASSGYVASRPVRLALASMIVVGPVLGWENTANATNTIWIFAAVVPWALLAMGENTRAVAVRATVAFVAAAATSLTFAYLPLAVGCAVARKARGTWIVVGSFLAGLALQGVVALHATNPHHLPVWRSISRLAGLTSVRVFGEYLVGDKGVDALWTHSRVVVVLAAPIAFALIYAVVFRGADRRSRVVSGVYVAYGLIMFALPIWGRGTNTIIISHYERKATLVYVPPHLDGLLLPNPGGTAYASFALRYSVIPVFMLASAIAVLVATGHRPHATIERVGRRLFVAQVVVLGVVGFSVSNPRSAGPTWSRALRGVYNARCRGRSPNSIVQIPTPTLVFPVVARCRDLE